MRVRLLALAAVVAACGSDNGPTKPSTNRTVQVYTIETSFSGDAGNLVTINAGDTVRWHFSVASDGLGHNVIFNPRPAGTPTDIAAETRSGSDFRVFSTPGTFHYVCTLHGSMTGDVVVQ
jgi:plastocyanin